MQVIYQYLPHLPEESFEPFSHPSWKLGSAVFKRRLRSASTSGKCSVGDINDTDHENQTDFCLVGSWKKIYIQLADVQITAEYS